MSKKKELILGAVGVAAQKFMYYDRKEDEDLPLNVIEKAVKNKKITVEEIVTHFQNCIEVYLKE